MTLRADRWLSRVRVGTCVRPLGILGVDTEDGEEVLVLYDVPPDVVHGYDIMNDAGMSIANLYYRVRGRRRPGVLLSAYHGDNWGVLLDARWYRWFGAGRGLIVRTAEQPHPEANP